MDLGTLQRISSATIGERDLARRLCSQARLRAGALLVVALTATLGVCCTVFLAPALSSPGASSTFAVTHYGPPPGPPPPGRADVRLAVSGASRPVPASFMGLSVEQDSLPDLLSRPALLDRALAPLRAAGQGPVQVRVGGGSTAWTYWAPNGQRPRSPWASDVSFALTPRMLSTLARVADEDDLSMVLELNLVAARPGMIGQWARAALRAFGARRIGAFEVGNEPDIYGMWGHLIKQVNPTFPEHYTPQDYLAGIDSYDRVLDEVAPGVPLEGPDIAYPNRDLSPSDHHLSPFLTTVVAHERRRLSFVSAHGYAAGCQGRFSRSARNATRDLLLSDQASHAFARLFVPTLQLARRHGLPLRLTEVNTVSCGGARGVSDAFVSALWAPDALFELMHEGISGVDIHVHADTLSFPFMVTSHGLAVRPLYYAMAMFSRMLGPDARLLDTRLEGHDASYVKVWAVRVKGAVHVLVINKRAASATATLPGLGPRAAVQMLTAPSLTARSGVRLAGQWFGRDGRWHGHRTVATVPEARGHLTVELPRFSAALVTIPTGQSAH